MAAPATIPDLPVLEGERVRIRPWRRSDAEAVIAASHDDFIPVITTVEANSTPDQALAYIERQWTRPATDRGHARAIADIETDEVIGQIGLWLVKLGVGRADIGYWVLRDRRGQGVATEALDLVATHALTVMPLQRVSLFIEPWNIGSRRTAERAGFEEEALLTAWETYDDGEPRDMHIYVRTRPDGPQR